MSSLSRLDTSARYSEAVVHGDTVYLAGQVPADGDADISTQCRSVFAQIDALLSRAGSSNRSILSAQVFLREIADVAAMNAEWERWIPANCAPARATVGNVCLVDTKWRVEICVIAAREK